MTPETQPAPPAQTKPSVGYDFEHAATVEMPPPRGVYDVTIIKFDVTASKDKIVDGVSQPNLGAYVNCQLQLNTAPAKDRQVFDMLQILLSGGEMVGTPAAYARRYSQGNLAVAVLKHLGIPLSELSAACVAARTSGPQTIAGAITKSFRGQFKHEKDSRDDSVRLRLAAVLGKPTGAGFELTSTNGKPKAAEAF